MIGINDWSMIDSGPHTKPMIGFLHRRHRPAMESRMRFINLRYTILMLLLRHQDSPRYIYLYTKGNAGVYICVYANVCKHVPRGSLPIDIPCVLGVVMRARHACRVILR